MLRLCTAKYPPEEDFLVQDHIDILMRFRSFTGWFGVILRFGFFYDVKPGCFCVLRNGHFRMMVSSDGTLQASEGIKRRTSTYWIWLTLWLGYIDIAGCWIMVFYNILKVSDGLAVFCVSGPATIFRSEAMVICVGLLHPSAHNIAHISFCRHHNFYTN